MHYTLQWYAALTEGHRAARVATTPRRPLCRTRKLTHFTSESSMSKQILHRKSCTAFCEKNQILLFLFGKSLIAKLCDSRYIFIKDQTGWTHRQSFHFPHGFHMCHHQGKNGRNYTANPFCVNCSWVQRKSMAASICCRKYRCTCWKLGPISRDGNTAGKAYLEWNTWPPNVLTNGACICCTPK